LLPHVQADEDEKLRSIVEIRIVSTLVHFKHGGYMKTPISMLLPFSIIVLASCTHLRTYSTLDDINAVSKDRKGLIILANGRGRQGIDFHLAVDSTRWRDLNTNKAQSIPTSQIREISIKKGGRGALEGFALGLLIGFGSGAIVGLVSGSDPENSWFAYSAGEKALGYGIVFGGGAGLLGLPIGAATGSKDKFVLHKEN